MKMAGTMHWATTVKVSKEPQIHDAFFLDQPVGLIGPSGT
jgi:hypothetical protein